MLFQTLPFFVFFAILYPVYLLTKETRLRLPLLLAASYVFYAWLSPLYLIPLAYATLVDYFIAGRIEKCVAQPPSAGGAMNHSRGRLCHLWLALSIVNDLGILAFFKYAGFVAENLNLVFSWLHIPYTVPQPGFLLPAGLSFYLLQSIGYTIDIYRGTAQREKSLLAYAVFVSFFPRLLAGPIERAGDLLPQLRQSVRVSGRDFTDGLSIFVVGYFKKVALADYLVLYVNKVYGAPEEFQAPALLLATFLFAWQIYFDFSGYTDMARGIGRMMGIRLMLNFYHPYLATGLGDFWQRWHISLSTWFKDYVYIPLGGNRHGEVATYRNMVLTMLISGLWHGAMWTFVIWGAVHAAGRVLTRALEGTPFYQHRVPKLAKQVLTFLIVCFAWVFFRAQSVGDAWLILRRIASCELADPAIPLLMIGLVLAIWIYQYVWESRLYAVLQRPLVRVALVVGMVVYIATLITASDQAFIYFQF